MKMISRATLLSPILLVTALAFARASEERTMQLNVGPLFNFARYDFACQPSRFQGYLAGVHADFAHIKQCREYVGVRFDGRWNAGDVCGCDQESTIKDYRTELDLGYNFDVSWCKMEDLRFTPFVGVGFFYLSDSFEFPSCSSSSCTPTCTPCTSSDCCELNYYNVFVPIGFKSEWTVNDCFSWGIDAEYRIDAWSRVKQNCGCDKEELDKRTQGVLIEVPMTWQSGEIWCSDFQVKVVPLFDWNKFGGVDHCSTSTCGASSSSSSSSSCNDCNFSSSSSSSDCCSSSSSCCTSPCRFDSNGCAEASRLKQWYLGLHVDLGIRF